MTDRRPRRPESNRTRQRAEWDVLRSTYLLERSAGRHRRPVACITWRSCRATSNRRSASISRCWSSRSPSCSRTGTTRDRRTSSSTSATGTALAFFDFPDLDVGDYAEVLGGLHHLAISVEPEKWERLRAKLD